MESSKNKLDYLLFEEYSFSSTNLGIYRIVYAICMLVAYLPQYLWIPTFPSPFFSPPLGLPVFFTGFPPPAFFTILNGLLVFTVFCLLVGYYTRVASVSFALLLLLGNSWAYSFGKINQDIPLVLIPLVLQFSGWGDSLSLDERRGKRPVHPSYNAWPVALLALLMGFAMFTAAVAKVATGWLEPRTHATLGHILRISLIEGRSNWITGQVLRINSGIAWELVDYSTVILEAVFLIAVVRRRAFQITCALACFFHLGIAGIMEITVWSNVVAYGAFCDWSLGSSSLARKALGAWTTLLNWLSWFKLVIFSGLVFILFMTVGNPIQNFSRSLLDRPEPIALWGGIIVFAAIVASVFLAGQICSTFSGFPSSMGLASRKNPRNFVC